MAAMPDLDHLSLEDYRDVYEPSDDTYLLIDALEADLPYLQRLSPLITLEIGPGSGCATAVLSRLLRGSMPDKKVLHMAIDINDKAALATVNTGKANKVSLLEVIGGDLVGPVAERLAGSVDVLLFNPPYVPTPSEEVGSRGIEAAWAGGVDGREVIDRVLPAVPALLSSDGGCFYLVVVDDNKPKDIMALMTEAGLRAEVLRTRRARNELLSILKFSKQQPTPVQPPRGDDP